MTIRSVNLQVVIPKSVEVSANKQLEHNKLKLDQQYIINKEQSKANENLKQVNNSEKAHNNAIKEKQEKDGNSKGKKKQNDRGMTNQDDDNKVKATQNKVNKIDIRI